MEHDSEGRSHAGSRLTADEEKALAILKASGNHKARDTLIMSNIPLVYYLSKPYQGRGVAIEDLISEGTFGLMRAVDDFDPTFNVRFSTYAAYWIRLSLRQAVRNHGKPIRLPHHTFVRVHKWLRTSRLLATQLKREPTSAEIGFVLKISARKIQTTLKAIEIFGLSQSFSDPREGNRIEDIVTDDNATSPESAMTHTEEVGRLHESIERLKDKEAVVIRMRFGLGTCHPMTLQEIGDRIGMTREGVRKIEKAALASLKRILNGEPES